MKNNEEILGVKQCLLQLIILKIVSQILIYYSLSYLKDFLILINY